MAHPSNQQLHPHATFEQMFRKPGDPRIYGGRAPPAEEKHVGRYH